MNTARMSLQSYIEHRWHKERTEPVLPVLILIYTTAMQAKQRARHPAKDKIKLFFWNDRSARMIVRAVFPYQSVLLECATAHQARGAAPMWVECGPLRNY